MKSIDFLPEQIRAARARRRRIIREVYLVVACGVALAAVGYGRHGQLQQARGELSEVNDQAARIQTRLVLVDSLEKQQADLMVIKLIEDYLGSRAKALDVLSELQSLLPTEIVLTGLEMETIPVPVLVETPPSSRQRGANWGASRRPTITVNRCRVVLTGLSPTDVAVANFIGQLSASPLFEDVNMGYVQNELIQDRRARKFQASCYVVR